MLKYAVRRVLQLIPMLLVLSIVTFLIIHMIPGDPVSNMLGPDVPAEMVETERARLGLDQPLFTQYVNYMKNLFQGDMGTSIVTGKPVVQELLKRYPPTLILAVGGTAVAAIIGVLFGIIAAVRHNKFADNFLMVVSLVSVSTPSFFLSLILMLIFCLNLRWLPSIGLKSFKHAILPVFTLGITAVGFITRTTRSAMLDVVRQDYIRTSRSRGIPEHTITFSHAFKNALIPVLTAVGLRFGSLLAGATLVETVFSIPGVGRFLVEGVLKRDYPVVQGTILVLASTFVIVNTIVDLLYAAVDPRIKYD